MKKSFLFFLILLVALALQSSLHAQSGPYGNEWIDYSKTYYKFKVGRTGICRIYRPALDAAGIPSIVSGSNFMLFRDGQEVPVWVSAETMGSGDYIEFWGRKADGLLDKELYLKPGFQPDDRISLFTDTACYYLTYDGGASHQRYVAAANVIPGGTLTPAPYCLATVGNYSRGAHSPGPSYATPDYDVPSSQYDDGEGFADGLTSTSQTLSASLQTPNLVVGINATIHAAIIARSLKATHQVKISVNGTQLTETKFGLTAAEHYDLTVPASGMSTSNQIVFQATPLSPGDADDYGISFTELEYPRNFNMSGLDQAALRLPATGASQYLEFTNMGAGRLYDVTNRKWYNGNTAVAGKTRFYLDPSIATRQMIVLSDAATSTAALTPVKTIRFTNYTAGAAQGSFVIISHGQLMQPTGGHSYVQEYGAYRASAAGGSRSVATADVTELYDQFAYGYDIHPLSIRHFLKYAYDKWTTSPQDVLLVGRGIDYPEYPKYRANPASYPFPIVPTYGVPGSDVDFVLLDTTQTPRMRIGRLCVWNAPEIGVYLAKVQASEALSPPAALPTVATEIWKKRALHITGANSASLDLTLQSSLLPAAAIIADTLTGKAVSTVSKSDKIAITVINSALVDSLLRGGVSLTTFYGHASFNTFNYTLPEPETYSNGMRMGTFLALGCEAGQMFDLANQKSIGERYTLAPNAGVTTFVSSSNTSFTDLDNLYLYDYYHSIAYKNYGAPMGTHYNYAFNSITNNYTNKQDYPNNYSTQIESMIFVGDPSITLPAAPKPDYAVADAGLSAIPGNVSTSLDSFKLRISAFNLGKAIADSVQVKVEHINPAKAITYTRTYTITNLRFSDTSFVSIPVNKVADLGLNQYRVTIDAANRYDETSELNNIATLEQFIYSDNLVPVYPKEFAIVNTQDLTLKASTLNPFRPMGRYKIEIDTTELFNSPLKRATAISSIGGVIKWKPGITLADSTVYYWRATFDSTITGGYQWSGSSFVYLAQGMPGWNQSHYFQYAKDNANGLFLQGDRRFHYMPVTHKLLYKNIVLCNGGSGSCNADGAHMQNFLDGTRIEQSSYAGVVNALSIVVIDTATGRLWTNPGNIPGVPPNTGPRSGTYSFQFDLSNQAGRIYAARFLDTIPDGNYVVIKNAYWHTLTTPLFIDTWKADSVVTGAGRDLYHTLYNMGFTSIDSFYRERVFIFMRRKADPTFPVYQRVTNTLSEFIEDSLFFKGSDKEGQYAGTVIGPAKEWKDFKWKTYATDTLAKNDTISVSISGIDKSGNETVIYPAVKSDTTLAGISAQQYPNIRLTWKSKDSVNLTTPQLAYWRVLYTPVPEAALNPAAHYVFSDSLAQGQMQTFSTAIENLSDQGMDSMLVRYKIIGADGVTRPLADKRYRPLPAFDTLHAGITFDPAGYPGRNLLFVEANPAADQPEEYHPNNLGYLPFRIAVDTHNPLLDVTFDGIHILNGDIVSAKPYIKIRLKDENRYLALDDTGLLRVALRYPSDSVAGTTHPLPFDGVTCKFVPAAQGGAVNEAVVELRPQLTEDGIYQLTVSGADKSGNGAGTTAGAARSEYKITFEVDNKPSITHVLNYPNPFSTSTAFVFTLTGSQIPSQFKIQILSVTGKVVREITRAELGPLHIGRNLTDYKWDGRDQYGQLLGNGVYLYRVVTALNGQDMDLRGDTREMSKAGGGIDKYFKGGYGKMYIMR